MPDIHCRVDFLWRQVAVDLLHGRGCPLHRRQCLSVDVGRLDGVDLLLERAYLGLRLLQAVLQRLLAPQRRHRRFAMVSYNI